MVKYTSKRISYYNATVSFILQLAGLPFLVALTIWGSWTLAKLLISDWLRLASSCRRDSFCCSITLFSSSMDFRLDSIVVIWGQEVWIRGCYCTALYSLAGTRHCRLRYAWTRYNDCSRQEVTYLCSKFDHVCFHLWIWFTYIFDFFIQLFDLLFMLQSCRGGTAFALTRHCKASVIN